MIRGLRPDNGVGRSEEGLIELDELDETEAERARLLRLKTGLAIGIGLEGLTLPLEELLVVDIVKEKRAGVGGRYGREWKG